ncbi:hypothetical protein Q1695_011064 [Nippostrongylus brasiliensis]|nr:hypothetical protein Q1695_011064 [Nippostrongylus brasiliensis]
MGFQRASRSASFVVFTLRIPPPFRAHSPLSMASVAHPPSAPQQDEIDINLSDPQVGEAAKKIQNVFRSRKQEKKPAPALAVNDTTMTGRG